MPSCFAEAQMTYSSFFYLHFNIKLTIVKDCQMPIMNVRISCLVVVFFSLLLAAKFSLFLSSTHHEFQVDRHSSILWMPKCRFRPNVGPLQCAEMTELFIRYLYISIFPPGNAKFLYILLKIMEDENIRLLMFEILGFIVYRFFVITVYVKNSLLEIIYINVEYSQFSGREKRWRHSVFSYFSATLQMFSKVTQTY